MKAATGGMKLAVAAACALLNGCRASEFMVANLPNAFSRLQLHADLAYGSDRRQRLDIVAPRQGINRPVVIFWYGGSWTQGRKADYRFVGVALAKQGFVAVLPDYRLYPKVTFPMFDEDAARAVAWVQRHVSEYGGDPTHIVLMGHSAGGHTAAFFGLQSRILAPVWRRP